ncbi:hypothetical protein PSPO01_04796 [Paraphaeosphaeria sporulosa]
MCHSPSSPATRKLQAHHPSSLQTQDGQLEPRNPPTHGLDTLNFNNSFLSPEFAPTEMRTVVQGAILIGVGGTAVLLQMAMPGIGAGVGYSDDDSGLELWAAATLHSATPVVLEICARLGPYFRWDAQRRREYGVWRLNSMQMSFVRLIAVEWMPILLREPFWVEEDSRGRRVGYWVVSVMV